MKHHQEHGAITPVRMALIALLVGLLAAAWFVLPLKPSQTSAPSTSGSERLLDTPQVGDLWLASAVPLSQGRAAGRTRYLLYRVEALQPEAIKVVMHKSQFDMLPVGDWQTMGLAETDFETSYQFEFAKPEFANQLLVQNDRDRVLRRVLMIKRGRTITDLQAPQSANENR